MKNAICPCGYVFPILAMHGKFSFIYGAEGKVNQICPHCGHEQTAIILAPREHAEDIPTQ